MEILSSENEKAKATKREVVLNKNLFLIYVDKRNKTLFCFCLLSQLFVSSNTTQATFTPIVNTFNTQPSLTPWTYITRLPVITTFTWFWKLTLRSNFTTSTMWGRFNMRITVRFATITTTTLQFTRTRCFVIQSIA